MTKKQEKKMKTIDTNSEKIQISELADMDFKITI